MTRTVPARLLVMAVALAFTSCGSGSPTQPSTAQPICTAVTTSAPVALQAGEFFRVKFRVPSGVTRELVVLSYLGLPESGFLSSTIVHRLFDGATLLGTQNAARDTVAFWKSAESSFGNPGDTLYGLSAPAVVINFDSIVNGTIDGRVELSVTTGAVMITSAELASVSLMGPARNFPNSVAATITARESCR